MNKYLVMSLCLMVSLGASLALCGVTGWRAGAILLLVILMNFLNFAAGKEVVPPPAAK